MASGWPMTPPESREKRAQLVPNSNSMGMPVTTPKTKLMAKMRPQKRAARSHVSLPVLQGHGLEHHDQQGQAHGELRKQIMEGDGEGEMQPVDDLSGHAKASC